jgi:polyphosphate kinase
MVRNLDHRFEVVCPIDDPKLQQELYDMLQIQLTDNCKARLVNNNEVNSYKVTDIHESRQRSQLMIYEYLQNL